MGWDTSKIILPPNSDSDNSDVEILEQSSANFALTYNFSGHSYIGRIARSSLR